MNGTDDERIYRKAHELWEAEGRPHGRDRDHWDQAKEIIALHDSAGAALLPRNTGAETPVEELSIAIGNEGEAPNLTDTGEHALTDTSREPVVTLPPKSAAAPASPAPARKAAAKRTAAPKDLSTSEAVPAKKSSRARAK